MSSRYLLLGCGRSRTRRLDPLAAAGARLTPREDFSDGQLVTVDSNHGCGPDVVINLDAPRWVTFQDSSGEPAHARELLERVPYSGRCFRESLFDEVHAYEVLEHLGRQGYAETFFETFREIWRVLKPDGLLAASVPSIHSVWAWGDPGHRRVITAESLWFLSRTTPLRPPSSDYRTLLDFDFAHVWNFDDGSNLHFVLRAVKPARPFAEL